jgi:branched-chain amino acid:cation transporter, LIVCS family
VLDFSVFYLKRLSMSDHPVRLFTVAFAVFSMFFGAGNLIYPLQVGLTSGNNGIIGLAGFLLTAVLLPFCGLLGMILFDGNYNEFFNRLGIIPGQIILCICLMVIGPVIAIPRIVTLSHVMTAPFLPVPFLQEITPFSSLIFGLIFLTITFIATYRPGKVVEVIGNIITPALLASLGLIIGVGLWHTEHAIQTTNDWWSIFSTNLIRGYETLDLLAGIFFASTVINMLKNNVQGKNKMRALTTLCLHAGAIGIGLLAMVYTAMYFLGIFHGQGAEYMNAGELFSYISFKILGVYGAAIIATAVFMACLSTAIALCATVARYIQYTICRSHIEYVHALTITIIASVPLTIYGLSTVLKFTAGPLVYIGYPVLISLTICNILYKTCGIHTVRIPVFCTFLAALMSYLL